MTSRTWASSWSLAFWVCSAVARPVLGVAVTVSSCQSFSRIRGEGSLGNGVQLHAAVDVQHAVTGDGRHVDRRADGNVLRLVDRLAHLEDVQLAGLGPNKDLAIDVVGRTPRPFLQVVHPPALAGLRVEAVKKS